MKILLVGEYSRLHNSLQEGLKALGHQVTLVSTGDDFKNFPADVLLKKKYVTGFFRKVLVGIYKLSGINISSVSVRKQFFNQKEKFTDFDVVQLINESPFGISPKAEKEIISFLKQHNKKLFLLSCGADYTNVKYALEKKLKYSIFEDYFSGKIQKKQIDFALKYSTQPFKELHHWVVNKVDGIIASDIDYHLPLIGKPNYIGMVPNPVNLSKIRYIENPVTDKIVIFLGINRSNYHSKGIRFFEEALQIINKKYSEKVTVVVAENLPYNQYIHRYNQAHIVLDQVLSYDQGYNALEAMAKGKVVFTGAEKEFEKFYNLDFPVAINALPNAQKIANELEKLIKNPELITQIGTNARLFIEKHHDFKQIAKRYLDSWKNN